jgi:translation initiation factor IF-2
VGTVAGSFIVDGKVVRGSHARLLRDNVVIYDGRISSLRRFKDDMKDCGQGLECGIKIENFNDVKMGDIIESYEIEEVQPQLS